MLYLMLTAQSSWHDFRYQKVIDINETIDMFLNICSVASWGKYKNCCVSQAVFHISHRAKTSFCTCLWVTETWARRQPRGTDWPLLCLHYPCSLPLTSPHRCLLIQCAAVKPATSGGQFRPITTEGDSLFSLCVLKLMWSLWIYVLVNREISAESENESQQLQNHWSEVRYLVRCIYRQTGTPLADDHDQPLERDKEGMKELVDR